jgi:hypothetical protein
MCQPMEICNMFSMYNKCTRRIDKWRKTIRDVFYIANMDTLKLKHPKGKFTKNKEIIS